MATAERVEVELGFESGGLLRLLVPLARSRSMIWPGYCSASPVWCWYQLTCSMKLFCSSHSVIGEDAKAPSRSLPRCSGFNAARSSRLCTPSRPLPRSASQPTTSTST